MKTLPLRDLVRKPTSVKKLTSRGQSVRITDNGKPLWIVQPDTTRNEEDEDGRKKISASWEEYWEEFLASVPEPKRGKSAAQVLLDARGDY